MFITTLKQIIQFRTQTDVVTDTAMLPLGVGAGVMPGPGSFFLACVTLAGIRTPEPTAQCSTAGGVVEHCAVLEYVCGCACQSISFWK
jgi:hypothetical protein